MIKPDWSFLYDKQKHVISLVGAGGKTTLLYELAAFFAAAGRKTLATTTTHIYKPKGSFCAADIAAAEKLWRQQKYAVAGEAEPETGKLRQLPPEVMRVFAAAADITLVEADGAKRFPCKAPAAHEPVLLPECDIVLGVAGMDAVGKNIEEGCFRSELARRLLGVSVGACLTESRLADILLSEQGTRKGVGGRKYYLVLNKCDLPGKLRQAELVKKNLTARGFCGADIWLRGGAVDER